MLRFEKLWRANEGAGAGPSHGAFGTVSNRREPVITGVVTNSAIPTLRWAPPSEHAAAILEFLQGPGGRTGTISYDELRQVHLDVCMERNIEPIGWSAVGRELRKLLGAEKTTDYGTDGRRRRVYRIPPASVERALRLV